MLKKENVKREKQLQWTKEIGVDEGKNVDEGDEKNNVKEGDVENDMN